MHVSLTLDVFTDSEALTDLLMLLRTFASGRHDLVAEPDIVAKATTFMSVQAPNYAAAYTEIARKGMVAAAWTPMATPADIVVITRAELTTAVADLCRPAVLVVEDQESDGYFIKALCKILRAERIIRAIDEGWLQISHGGGSGGLVKVAKEEASRFHCTTRVAALLDSDRLIPGQPTKQHDKAAELAAIGIVVHVLEFREAENYIPDQVLGLLVRRPQGAIRLTVFRKLNTLQRAYFDMKKGFGAAAAIPPTQQSLYAGLSPWIVNQFRRGYGDDLLKALYDASDSLTERDFAELGDSVVPELRSLLAKLASVI